MKRVLVVEPHPHVLTALAELVEEEPGYELAGAVATITEAMSQISDLTPDIILVDTDTATQESHRLGELLPMALLVHLSAATEPHKERPDSSAKTPSISILKTDAPEFLRSLTA
ncbi:response regulator transcription factor [Streptomyces sp. NPDC056628]|uniref:response regulator transcription factor n=1 Tax=Streptomyces sp. NPDC056628 TaxID=3345882 RepID=UPI0036A0FB1A